MQTLTVRGVSQDAARYAASCCGSLAAPNGPWDAFFEALTESPSAARLAAEGIVCVAIPEPEWPHPQRADVSLTDGGRVLFETPGGVSILLTPSKGAGKVDLQVDFSRNSKWLACQMLVAVLFESGTIGPTCVVDGAEAVPITTAVAGAFAALDDHVWGER